LRNEREMALSQQDLLIGLGALAVSAFAIYMFVRASSSTKKPGEGEGEKAEEKPIVTSKSLSVADVGNIQIPRLERHMGQTEVERARSGIRTLTLQQELLSMILKRLFEAEDDGEITRDERVRLSKGYEGDLKRIEDELKQSQLIVTLHELEAVREDILKKFEETLNSTQARIDSILKELKIEAPKVEEPVEKPPPRRRRPPPRRAPEEEPEEEEEEPEEEAVDEARPRPKSEVEAKLEELRKEVLKELEELEKLEIEV
jgi:hypothetical protein